MTEFPEWDDVSIYYDKSNRRWIAAVSLGFDGAGKRVRPKLSAPGAPGDKPPAKTRKELLKKYKDLRAEYESGTQTPKTYTVRAAVNDWFAAELADANPATVAKLRILAERHVLPHIGAVKLKDLKPQQVHDLLVGLKGKLSTRTLQDVHSILRRTIRHAQYWELIGRNVAELVKTPQGTAGRPSKALTQDDAVKLLDAARSSRWHAYIVLSLMTGIRTEEARALTWDRVGLTEEPYIEVWRSVRRGGDTKTKKSKRTLALPARVADALKAHRTAQAADRLQAGPLWQDNNLVFCTAVGTPLDAANVRRGFRAVVKSAGIEGTWTPRELRHSFVSIMSANGVPVETIAHLAGHAGTAVTEAVYRKELRPVLTAGAERMETIFSEKAV